MYISQLFCITKVLMSFQGIPAWQPSKTIWCQVVPFHTVFQCSLSSSQLGIFSLHVQIKITPNKKSKHSEWHLSSPARCLFSCGTASVVIIQSVNSYSCKARNSSYIKTVKSVNPNYYFWSSRLSSSLLRLSINIHDFIQFLSFKQVI